MLDRKEVLRYLGCRTENALLERMAVQAEKLVLQAAAPVHVFRRTAIRVEDDTTHVGTTALVSRDLAAHLNGCREVYLLALTLGPGIDRLIRRSEVADPPMVPVLQACAAVYTEFCADEIQKSLEAQAGRCGLYLRPRYSPGYGDFSLEYQRFFFDSLEITKRIGVFLTDSFLMIPCKSITAVLGLSEKGTQCHVGKCMSCKLNKCPFRK